jgi:hypothetical protein
MIDPDENRAALTGQVPIPGKSLQLPIESPLHLHKSRSPTDMLHAGLQHILLRNASSPLWRASIRRHSKNQTGGTGEHRELVETMAGSDSLLLHIHHPAVPLHVLRNICCVLADISFLLE